MSTIDRELIHCTRDGCVNTGCQAVLMDDGQTVILANLRVSADDIKASGLASVLAENPGKGLMKGELDAIIVALEALKTRRDRRKAA